MKLNNKGFTLVEMIVVTAIFVVVIMIAGDAFKTILTQSSKLAKSEESNIEGVVGLEMLRHDLEQGGFGLPFSFDTPPIIYTEAAFNPYKINDAPSNVPRAFAVGNNVAAATDNSSTNGGTFGVLAGTDYLAIKATSVGGNDASQKWTYLTYSSLGRPAKLWPSGNFKSGDRLIMLRRTFQDTGYTNQLAYDTSNPYSYSVNLATSGYPTGFAPTLPTEIFYVYGLRSKPSGTDPGIGMPFNRVDYFVATPSSSDSQVPSTCAPGGAVGVLYRANVNHKASGGGALTYMPILDCVADMQVVFGWDLADSSGNLVTDANTMGDGHIDTWSNADGSSVTSDLSLDINQIKSQVQTAMTDPGHIRTKLKLIKVYILAQNGKKDTNYTSPATINIGDPGEASLTRPGGFPITSDMQNYRWKVYRIVVKPKNLISNQ